MLATPNNWCYESRRPWPTGSVSCGLGGRIAVLEAVGLRRRAAGEIANACARFSGKLVRACVRARLPVWRRLGARRQGPMRMVRGRGGAGGALVGGRIGERAGTGPGLCTCECECVRARARKSGKVGERVERGPRGRRGARWSGGRWALYRRRARVSAGLEALIRPRPGPAHTPPIRSPISISARAHPIPPGPARPGPTHPHSHLARAVLASTCPALSSGPESGRSFVETTPSRALFARLAAGSPARR